MTLTIGYPQAPTSWAQFNAAGANQVATLGPTAMFRTPPDAPGFITRLGGYLFASANPTNLFFVCYEIGPDWRPGRLIAWTPSVTAWATLSTFYEMDCWAPAPVNGGTLLGLGVYVWQGEAWVGSSAHLGAATLFWRNVAGQPSDPFGPPGFSSTGVLSLYARVEENREGVTALTGPAEGAVVASPTPTLSARFDDPDFALGDRPARFFFEVRRQGETDLLWSAAASQTPPAAGSTAGSRVYAGAALARGETYEWRGWGQDRFGVASAPAPWRAFTVAEAGSVDLTNATPTGKVGSGVVAAWTARWTHPDGLAMDRARLRLSEATTGTLLHESGEIAKAAANNAVFTLSAAEVGVATAAAPLAPGRYAFEIVGRSTDGAWGAWGGPRREFTVNSPPNVPAGLTPVAGSVVGARPRLEWVLTDPDVEDVVGVAVEAFIELTRPNGTVRTIGPILNVDPATGRMFYQTTATDVPDGLSPTTPFEWRVIGHDNQLDVYSPSWSAPATFVFRPSPVPTITSPGATTTTASPVIQWTVAGGPMTRFRVDLFRAWESEPFFSSGEVAASGSAGAYQVPGGWLGNKLTYTAIVTVWAGDLAGSSQGRVFTVNFPDAASMTGVNGSTILRRRDVEPTMAYLTWAPTTLPAGRFAGYLIRRREATRDAAAAIPVAHLTAPSQVSFADNATPPNRPLIYSVSQLERVGADLRESPPVEALLELPIETPTLSSLRDPWTLHAAVKWLDAGISGGFARPAATYLTWGARGKPTLVQAPPDYGQRTAKLSFTLRRDEWGSAEEHFRDWEALVVSGHELVLRTEDGIGFYRISGPPEWWKRGAARGTREVTLDLEEIAHEEAIRMPT